MWLEAIGLPRIAEGVHCNALQWLDCLADMLLASCDLHARESACLRFVCDVYSVPVLLQCDLYCQHAGVAAAHLGQMGQKL